MPDAGPIFALPGFSAAANQAVSAVFEHLLAPMVIGIAAAWMAGKQFRHTILTEKQRSAAQVVEQLVEYGRKLDARLVLCDEARLTGEQSKLQILGDAQPPPLQDAAVALGPKAAMQFQALRDAYAASFDSGTAAFVEANELAVAGHNPDIPDKARRISNAFEDVLLETYRSIDITIRSANLSYKPKTRLSMTDLEKRRRRR
jgi:hypothetical protein